jgi:2-oxoglutarate ferredoxin oxidoreductase subunit delta
MPKIRIDQRLCKKCGICADFCPEGIVDPDRSFILSENCKLCRLCEIYCPDFAIEVYEVENEADTGE